MSGPMEKHNNSLDMMGMAIAGGAGFAVGHIWPSWWNLGGYAVVFAFHLGRMLYWRGRCES